METLFVLVLYMNGIVKEHMAYWEDPVTKEWVEMGLPGCLAMKRTLKRNGWKDSHTGQTRFACEKHEVEIGPNWENLLVVKKILTFDKNKKEKVKL